jgi:hypothetical protein
MLENIRIKITSLLFIVSGIYFIAISVKELATYLPNPQFRTAAAITVGIPIIAMCLPLIGGCLILFVGVYLSLLKEWARKGGLFILALLILIGLFLADSALGDNVILFLSITMIIVSAYFFWYLTRKSTKELFE